MSVVLAAFNAARTIEAAIRSVLSQEDVEVEVLVCDDASTDNTAGTVEGMGDPRVHVVRNPANLGPGESRNRLMDAARGEYIAFLDADDAFAPGRLSGLLAVARSHAGALVFDDILECHDLGDRLAPFRNVHGPHAFARTRTRPAPRQVSLEQLVSATRLLVKPMLPTSSMRRLDVRQSSHRYGEDGLFLWRAVARGIPAIYVPRPTYFYRVTPGSLSANPERHALVADCLRLVAEEPGLPPRTRQRALERAADFEALARLRGGTGPTVAKALRYFAERPRRLPKWLVSFARLRWYAFTRWRAGAPRR